MATIGELLVRVGADIEGFQAGMADINSEIRKAERTFNGATKGWADAFSSLQSVGIGLTAAITAPLVGIGLMAVQTSEQINMARLSFTTMLGSAQAAGDYLKQLQAFAASTPFEFPDLVTAAKRMMAMGFAASDVIPTLRIIGDSVAALGGGKEMIDRVTLALGQMGAKGKVSAQEMNQLAENGIPAWQMLADKIGMSIPQAMKAAEQGAISASVAIPAILDGMNAKFAGQMDKASKTLTGVWSNFKDQATFILGDIGNQLAPILKDLVTNVAMPFLAWVRDVTTWFSNLDPTMQKVLLGFTALAAAIGPILLAVGTLGQAWIGVQAAMTALGPIFSGIGGAIAGLSAPALATAAAVAAVTAALVAIGIWVYDNWAAISDTLSFAWVAVKEAFSGFTTWVAAWAQRTFGGLIDSVKLALTPLIAWYSFLWDTVKTVTIGAWNIIKNSLVDAWEAIKAIAQTVWKGITAAIEGFIAIAKKIPGTAKLFQIDDVWKKNKQAMQDAEAAAKSNASALSSATGQVKSHTSAVQAGTIAISEKTKKKKDLLSATEELKFGEIAAKITTDALTGAWVAFNQTAIQATAWMKAQQEATALLGQIAQKTAIDLKTVPDAIRLINDQTLDKAIGQVNAVKDAYGLLGVQSTEVLLKKKQAAIDAYETIKNSGTASARDIEAAYKAMTGQVESLNKDLAGKSKTAWGNMAEQVSTIMTDFGKDIAKMLFDGDTSFGEKAKGMLKSLGEAVVRTFVEPMTKALNDMMTGVIKDLLGGKGFGGMLDSLKEIGSNIKDIFGATNNAGGVAGQAGGAAGQAGGAAGGAGAGAASGVAGVVGAIAGVVSAVSGIIGNFQMMGMNKSLDIIVLHTLQTANDLANLRRDAWDREGHLMFKLDDIWASVRDINTSLVGGLFEKLDWIVDGLRISVMGALTDISGGVFESGNTLSRIQAIDTQMLAFAAAGADRPNVTINATSGSASELAAEVVRILRAQGVIK